MMKLLLFLVQLLVAVIAAYFGAAMINDPTGVELSLPLSFIQNSPFSDYFFPGLVLLIVVGGGHLIGALLTTISRSYRCEYAVILALTLTGLVGLHSMWMDFGHNMQYAILGIAGFEFLFGLIFSVTRPRSRSYKMTRQKPTPHDTTKPGGFIVNR